MATKSTTNGSEHFFADAARPGCWWRLPVAGLILFLLAGCQTSKPKYLEIGPGNTVVPELSNLREGDVIRVTFTGAPNFNPPSQQIRQDGNITLPEIGEIKAAGKTPTELQKELTSSYAAVLVNPTVIVTVETSSFSVYVNGAVLHQGKVTSNHPLTALEAIMEAGGPDFNKANLKKVKVTRQEGPSTQNYMLDLQKSFGGDGKTESFYLKPGDIIFVPEGFQVFH